MRAERRIAGWLFAAVAAALAACQNPDVGQPCTIGLQDVASACADDAQDFFESGIAVACEDNIVCIHTAGEGCTAGSPPLLMGRCSKACVSDTDCFKSQTGLVCRQVVLDGAFLASLPEDVKQRYLADINQSNYCAQPSPPPAP